MFQFPGLLAQAANVGADSVSNPVALAMLLLISTAALAMVFLLALVLMRFRRWMRRQEQPEEPTDAISDAWAEAGRRLHVEPAGGPEKGDRE